MSAISVMGLTVIGLATLAAAAFLLSILVRIANSVILDIKKSWASYYFNRESAKAELSMRVQHILPDQHGFMGALVFPDGSMIHLDERFTLEVDHRIARQLLPINEQLLGMRRLLAALPDHVSQSTIDKVIAAEPMIEIHHSLPEMLPLQAMLSGQPSIQRVPLGQILDESGQVRTISAPLQQLVHLLIAGQNGAGKSVAIQSYAYYLWSTGQVDLAFIDPKRVTFTRFRDCGLMWPIATQENMIVALLQVFIQEMNRRLALMEQHKGVDDIWKYNNLVEVEDQLRPMVLFIDELPDVMALNGVEDRIGEIVRTGRKAGTWLWCAGTSFRAVDFPVRYRDQFHLRACLYADVHTGQTTVGSRDTAHLKTQGRALAQLPLLLAKNQSLNPLVEMQLPLIPEGDPMWDKLEQVNRPVQNEIEGEVIEIEPDIGLSEKIVTAWNGLPEGKRNITATARIVWPDKIEGSAGGYYFNTVKAALRTQNLIE